MSNAERIDTEETVRVYTAPPRRHVRHRWEDVEDEETPETEAPEVAEDSGA